MALLKTSADIGLLPESSANIMEDIRMTRDVREINVTGINITELQGEKRFRLQSLFPVKTSVAGSKC